jgi:hypothetical protein
MPDRAFGLLQAFSAAQKAKRARSVEERLLPETQLQLTSNNRLVPLPKLGLRQGRCITKRTPQSP